jgi:hypothetical protein
MCQQEIVDEHIDALNRGDWERLMAQYLRMWRSFDLEVTSFKVEIRSAICFGVS